MTYKIKRPVIKEYIPLSDKLEKQLDKEWKAKHGGKGWEEAPDYTGKAPEHVKAATKRKTDGVSKSPMRKAALYSNYDSHEKTIAKMLTESTGINMLDSGGVSGRGWQRNQGIDFKNEPATTYEIGKGDNSVLISFNVFHYLKTYTDLTTEARKLQSQFMKFARSPEHADDPWMQSMEEFAEMIDDGSVRENYFKGTTNTYNYDNILSQILQYTGFTYNEKIYVLLQIHNGADARGGYTAPQIFEIPEPDYFIIAQNDVMASDDKGHRWSSDDGGNHWQSDDEESGELEIEERNRKAYHKGCGSELDFNVMESY